MKKLFLVSFFISIATHAICQNEQMTTFDIRLSFNNYVVCDLLNNFEMYFFYVDSNNYYKIEKAKTEENSIHTSLNFKDSNSYIIIFKYKSYTLLFNSHDFSKEYPKNSRLDFKIEKIDCYKKYIRKSYSKSFKNGNRKLSDKDFDVSCNGLADYDGNVVIDIFNVEYRKSEHEHFKEVAKKKYRNRKTKAKGEISLSYEVKEPWVYSHRVSYTNYKKFFTRNELFFQEFLLMDGKPKDETKTNEMNTKE